MIEEAGGEEAFWEEAANQAKRDFPVSTFLAAEFHRMLSDEFISYGEAQIRTGQAAIAAATIVMTDGPPIDTTLEAALAYIEWFWAWERERLEQQPNRYPAPPR